MRWPSILVLAACGTQLEPAPPVAEPLTPRARILTDSQYANAVHDLVGDIAPALAVQTPGARPHQFHSDGLVAVDAALLAQYRVAAESIAREIARRPVGCGDATCRAEIADFGERAFRRPLEPAELDQLASIYALGPTPSEGWSYVVETVLQAPSFIYRAEHAGELTSWELAADLAFWLLDSIPDEELHAVARDGSLTRPAVLEAQVDRLLATDRVHGRIDDIILDWLEVRRVLDVDDLSSSLRQSMVDESARFVDDVLWHRGGSLRTLLTSRESFVDRELAAHYEIEITGDVARITHAPARAGILTHASLLVGHAERKVSIIKRGMLVNRALLCSEELGRPPFAAISEVSSLTSQMSDSQFAHYRAADLYCSGCHRTIDPPGRALLAFDLHGLWRVHDENAVTVESDVELELDGARHRLTGAPDLARLLADSDQVARCVVDQLARHALGAPLDAITRSYLVRRFEDSDRDLVDLIRAIATSPGFRTRGAP